MATSRGANSCSEEDCSGENGGANAAARERAVMAAMAARSVVSL